MADVTEERIKQAVNNIKDAFADGFQIGDISVLTKEVTVFAEAFKLSGPEKKALAMRVAEQVLDETDIPYVPDKLSLPIIGEVGADKWLLMAVDKGIDLLVSASKGELPLNKRDGSTE